MREKEGDREREREGERGRKREIKKIVGPVGARQTEPADTRVCPHSMAHM